MAPPSRRLFRLRILGNPSSAERPRLGRLSSSRGDASSATQGSGRLSLKNACDCVIATQLLTSGLSMAGGFLLIIMSTSQRLDRSCLDST